MAKKNTKQSAKQRTQRKYKSKTRSRVKIAVSVSLIARLLYCQQRLKFTTLGSVGLQAFMAGAYRISSEKPPLPAEVLEHRTLYSDINEDFDGVELPPAPIENRLSMTISDDEVWRLIEYLYGKLKLRDAKTGELRFGAQTNALKRGIEAGLPFIYALPHVGAPTSQELKEIENDIHTAIIKATKAAKARKKSKMTAKLTN